MNQENIKLAKFIHEFMRERNTLSVIECDYLAEQIIKGFKTLIHKNIQYLEKIKQPSWAIEIEDKQDILNKLLSEIQDINY